MSGTVQLPVSVGLGDVAIHIEVPGDLGQGEFGPFQLRSQHDLAAQPGVLLEERGHIQHVVLPLIRRWQKVQVVFTHIHVAGGARQGSFAGPWERQVRDRW